MNTMNLLTTVLISMAMLLNSSVSAQDVSRTLIIRNDSVIIIKRIADGEDHVSREVYDINTITRTMLKNRIMENFDLDIQFQDGIVIIDGEPLAGGTTEVTVDINDEDMVGLNDVNPEEILEKAKKYTEKASVYAEMANKYAEKVKENTGKNPQEAEKYSEKAEKYGEMAEEYAEKSENLYERYAEMKARQDEISEIDKPDDNDTGSDYEYVPGIDGDEDEEDDLDNIKTRWFLLRVGVNSFIKEDVPEFEGIDPTDLKIWPSINWGIDVFQIRFNLIKHYVNLRTGLGFDLNYYEFESDATLQDKTSTVQWIYKKDREGDIYEYSRNNLYAAYIRMPLILNFETNPYNQSHSFNMNVGVYGGLRIDSRLKQKWANKKLIVNDDFNLSDWTYGLTGSIGYGWFNIYATYSLVGLFDSTEDNGYSLTPFTVGIQILTF